MRPIVFALGLLFIGSAAAGPSTPPSLSAPGSAPQLQFPDQIVRQGVDRLIGFLVGSTEPTPAGILTFVESQIAPYFDFDYMARWVAGPSARNLDAGQRERLIQKLRALFLTALANNLGSFRRPLPEVRVYSARGGRSAKETLVPVRVIIPAAQVMRLGFRFYWTGRSWKMFDVSANGASAVAYYRRYFSEEIRRHGLEAALQ